MLTSLDVLDHMVKYLDLMLTSLDVKDHMVLCVNKHNVNRRLVNAIMAKIHCPAYVSTSSSLQNEGSYNHTSASEHALASASEERAILCEC